jgi:hypothetical protein
MKISEKVALISLGVIILAVVLFVPSCAGTNHPPVVQPPSVDIHNIGTDVQATHDTLDTSTKGIKTEAQTGMQKTPTDVKPVLEQHWVNILTWTGVQEQLVKNLEETKKKVDTAQANAVKFENLYKSEQAARIKAEDNATKEFRHKIMTWAGICFGLSLLFGGLAFYTHSSWIKGVAVMCVIGLLVCVALVQTIALIPWVAGGLAVIGAGVFLYDRYGVHKATTELVKTVEAQKPLMTLEGRKKLFGSGPTPGDVNHIQTPFTRQLVKQIRKQTADKDLAPQVPTQVAVDYNGDGVIDKKDIEFIANNFFRSDASAPSAPSALGRSIASKTTCSGRRKITGPVRAKIILN